MKKLKAKSFIKLLDFNFFMCSLLFSFQLFTPKILWLLAFSSWLSASFPALAFFHKKLRKIGRKPKLKKNRAFVFLLLSSKLFSSFLLLAFYILT